MQIKIFNDINSNRLPDQVNEWLLHLPITTKIIDLTYNVNSFVNLEGHYNEKHYCLIQYTI